MRLLLSLAVGVVALAGCRPVVRACSADDRCPVAHSCVGGRCQADNQPAAVDSAERVVLTPRRLVHARRGAQAALLFDFDLRDVPLERLVEAHVLVQLTEPALAGSSVHLNRMSTRWDERSSAALRHMAQQESEVRLQPASPPGLRLQVAARGLARQAELGWALRLLHGPEAPDGVHFAEDAAAGPRLELYLRPKAPAHTVVPRP